MAATQEPTTQEPTTQEATPKWECCVCYEDGTATAQMTLRCSHPICLGCFSAMRTTTNFYGGAPPPPCCPLCRQAIRTQAGLTQEEQVEQRRRYVDLAERRRQAATVQRLLQEQEASYQTYIRTNADRQAYHATLQQLQRTGEEAIRQAPAPVAAAPPPPVAAPRPRRDSGPPGSWPGDNGTPQPPPQPPTHDQMTGMQVRQMARTAAAGWRLPGTLVRHIDQVQRCPGCATHRPAEDMRHRRINTMVVSNGRWYQRTSRLMRCMTCAQTAQTAFVEQHRLHPPTTLAT